MTNTSEKWRTQPMYTFGEAARLANLSPITVRNWFVGYTTRTEKEVPPLFPGAVGQNSMISFLRLIETVVAAQLRNSDDARWRNVREAYWNAREGFRVEYPFAHVKLIALGEYSVAPMNLPTHVIKTINQLEYEDDLAARWYPAGKKCHIVIDPRIGSGIPTVAGRGISVQTIHKRRKAGQDIDFIARDLALKSEVVEIVLQYGDRVAA